jgi:hypothetical protein
MHKDTRDNYLRVLAKTRLVGHSEIGKKCQFKPMYKLKNLSKNSEITSIAEVFYVAKIQLNLHKLWL